MGEIGGAKPRANRSRRSLKRLARRQVVALSIAGLLVLLVTAGALAATGDLTQPAGVAGCISEDGTGPCADGHGLGGGSLALSPDGKNVYVTGNDTVVRLNRNTTTGAISQPAGAAGCVSQTGAGPCADGHALNGANGVAVSPDGKNVYVTGSFSDAVVRLNRNTTTGAIAQPAGATGCVSETGAGPCVDGHALNGASGVAVSPDGKNVYVASFVSRAVVRLSRNTTTGAIGQPPGTAGCVSETGAGPCADGHALDGPSDVAVSPDGKNVYAGVPYSDAVVRLNRDTTTGAIAQPAGSAGCISQTGAGPCADGRALRQANRVAASPDGKNVYVTSHRGDQFGSAAVVRLDRTSTGAITQPAGTTGCWSEFGAGPCADGHALNEPFGVVVSPDGRNVYVTAASSDAVVRFNRGTTTGAITQPPGTAGCMSETGAGPCANGHALDGAGDVAVSPDGKSVYVASSEARAVVRLNRAP